jgi:hypothetical protein
VPNIYSSTTIVFLMMGKSRTRIDSRRRRVLATGSGGLLASVAGCSTDPSAQDTRQTEPPTTSTGAGDAPAQTGTPGAAATFDHLQAERINDRYQVSPDDDLAALLADAEPGSTFVLSAGTHEVDETLRADVNRITIRGQGWKSTTIERTGDFRLLELHGVEGDHAGSKRRRFWTIENLQLSAGDGGTSDLVHQRWSEGHRWTNVGFSGWGSTGNNIYAEQCWDQTFVGCVLMAGGDPEAGTADVYWYNTDVDNTNNWRFVNCRWEKLNSHAIYSDNSGGGGPNGRLFLVNCKFHGFADKTNVGERQAADVYPLDLSAHVVKISNCWFVYSRRGWIRIRSDVSNTTQIVNSAFRNYKEPALNLGGKENYIAHNSFWGPSTYDGRAIHVGPEAKETALIGNVTGGADPSIHVEANRATVTGNVVDFDGFFDDAVHADIDGIVVSGEDSTVGQNVVTNAGGAGIRFDGAAGVAATGNVVRDPRGKGIVAGDGDRVLIGNNVVRGAGTPIEAPDAQQNGNLTL